VRYNGSGRFNSEKFKTDTKTKERSVRPGRSGDEAKKAEAVLAPWTRERTQS